MRVSPSSRWGTRSAMVGSTAAVGTINQMARGFSSFFTRSASDEAPTAFSLANCWTASGDRSKTAQWCPPLSSRRTMLAPIRPSPIMPSCIVVSFVRSTDQRLPGHPCLGVLLQLAGIGNTSCQMTDEGLGSRFCYAIIRCCVWRGKTEES